MFRTKHSACLIVMLALVVCSSALAQETRATLLGRVIDATGGVLPGVSIIVTNTDTNVSNHLVTNDEGLYRVPFLMPGPYQVTAELSGFKTYVRKGITLSINTEAVVDVKMEVGEMSQSVTVTAEEPLLNTTSATVAQVIDNKRVMELPILGNSAMLMSGLAFGMQRGSGTDGYNYLGLHSTVGASAYSTAGGVGGNEWSLDGTPNSGHTRRSAYLPYADAIDEFRVESTSFDAKVGHTTGASVTMSSKSGTNQLHGTLTENHWQQRWNATPNNDNGAYWKKIKDAEAAGNQALANELRNQPRQPSGRSNNYAASIGGPVKIPWLYDGKDKLFFFFIFNGFKDAKTEESGNKLWNVPTEAHRRGDFSDLINISTLPNNGKDKYQIYDPLTTVYNSTSKLYERQPFPNNIIPASRIVNPMYKFYEKLFPLPNHPPNEGVDTSNNYFNGKIPFNWDYKAVQNRVDYVHSETDKFFFRWSYNKFLEDRNDWTFDTARYLHSNSLNRINKGAGADWVHTFSPSDVLHVAVAYNRYVDNEVREEMLKYKPSDVGLPGYMDEKAGDYAHLPRVDFSDGNYKDVSASYGILNPISTATLTADYSKYFGKHSLAFGWDGRNYYRVSRGPGTTSGYFEFRNGLLRKTNTQSGVGNLGLEWAAFMLGIPNVMSVDTNDTRYITTPYHGLFVQDNYRLNPKLTVNVGVRLEYEGSIRERFDRGLRDWNFKYKLPDDIYNAFKTGYQANPLPDRTLDSVLYGLVGGVNYLGQDAPRTRTNPTWRAMPRVGMAYKISDAMVVRAGYGQYYDTLNVSHTEIDQTGYSRSTSSTITTDNGITWGLAPASWNPTSGPWPPVADPFPIRGDGTRYNVPLGNSLAHLSYLGRGYSFISDLFEPSQQHRWRLEIERQVTGDSVFSIGYAGSYVPNLGVDINRNAVPEKYWVTANERKTTAESWLNGQVTNPFKLANFAFLATSNPALYQQMTTTGFFTGSTMSRAQLLRPYPHISGDLNEQRVPIGKNVYHAMQVRFEKRMSNGWTFNTHYEWNRNLSKDWMANSSLDQAPTWRESDNSRPHRWVATSLYELPFGDGKWLLNRKGWVNSTIGGWQLGTIWQMQSGECVDFGNVFFLGKDTHAITLAPEEQTKDRWFNNGWDYPTGDPRNAGVTNKLWVIASAAGYQRRTSAQRFNWVRTDVLKQLDVNVQKAFHVTEGVRALFRVDLLNAPNHQVMSGPNADPTSSNFGKVTGYINTQRYIQFQLRIQY